MFCPLLVGKLEFWYISSLHSCIHFVCKMFCSQKRANCWVSTRPVANKNTILLPSVFFYFKKYKSSVIFGFMKQACWWFFYAYFSIFPRIAQKLFFPPPFATNSCFLQPDFCVCLFPLLDNLVVLSVCVMPTPEQTLINNWEHNFAGTSLKLQTPTHVRNEFSTLSNKFRLV